MAPFVTIQRSSILTKTPLMIAGPCAVESEMQIMTTARYLSSLGVEILRAPLWKPRTNPQNFQGIGLAGLTWLEKVKAETGMLIALEIVDASHIEATKGIVDILWVGARNMQNYELLKRLAKDDRVVILKRGFAATLDEWLASANYIGMDRVILCERGIRTGVQATRFCLDFGTALVAKQDHHMPVIVDTSHAAGRNDLVSALSSAAIAAGLDGLILEVHPDPVHALSDAAQQLTFDQFVALYVHLKQIPPIV